MLRQKLKEMVTKYGKKETENLLNKELQKLMEDMRKATNIYHAIDIEHDILDRQAMLKWLKDV